MIRWCHIRLLPPCCHYHAGSSSGFTVTTALPLVTLALGWSSEQIFSRCSTQFSIHQVGAIEWSPIPAQVAIPSTMPANSINMSTLVQAVFDHAELSNLFASTVSQLARQVLTINHQEEENIDAEQIQCGVQKLARHAVEAVWRPIVWKSLVHRYRTTASSKLVRQLSHVATARAAQRGFLTEWAAGALLCRRLKHTSQMVVQARAVLCIQPVWRDWLYRRHSQRALPKILSGIRSSHWQRSVDSNAAQTISKHLGSSALQVCNALGWQPPSSCRTSMELSIGQAVWHKEGLQWFEGKITSCNTDGSVDLTTKYGSVVGAQ